jgi:hypothetical protein
LVTLSSESAVNPSASPMKLPALRKLPTASTHYAKPQCWVRLAQEGQNQESRGTYPKHSLEVLVGEHLMTCLRDRVDILEAADQRQSRPLLTVDLTACYV